ncbi:MAG: hypothetical protein SFH39_00115 [Candidatus Magnetobacterium sp. LHC-1]
MSEESKAYTFKLNKEMIDKLDEISKRLFGDEVNRTATLRFLIEQEWRKNKNERGIEL